MNDMGIIERFKKRRALKAYVKILPPLTMLLKPRRPQQVYLVVKARPKVLMLTIAEILVEHMWISV